VYIRSIEFSNFRNLTDAKLEFDHGTNVLHGNNGAGKTNLLEAIFTLCLSRSHRGARDQVLVKHGEEIYRVAGEIGERDGLHEVAVAYQKGGRKKITIDSIPARASELYENNCVVSVGPEDTEILSGSPSVRRNFLNVYLSQFSANYLSNLIDYQKALAHKNASLKAGTESEPFNELLVKYGAQIIKARLSFIEKLGILAGDHYAEISPNGRLHLIYQPSVSIVNGQVDVEGLEQSFRASLAKHREREKDLRSALVGPHRDELVFELGEFPARTHGSQGEWRTAAITLKVAVYLLLKEKRKLQPVLLLDEIFAELDKGRAEALMRSFSEFGQLFVTTLEEQPKLLLKAGKCFSINQGKVQNIK